MSFQWLKRYMPRSLYGRAALILVLPVLLLQVIVTLAFIQRHFEDVAIQMTDSVALDLRFVAGEVRDAPDLSAARAEIDRIAPELGLEVALPADNVPERIERRFYDLSGLTVARSLRANLDGLLQIALPNNRDATVWVETPHGPMRITFDRRRASASNPHQMIVVMTFFGIILTGIAYIYLRNQLRPITRLSRAATEFGKGRVVPYHASGATEVRAAGRAFLEMRARIERQTQTRTMMLSGVSHDLRTPLTRLRLGLSMLDDAEAEPMMRDVEEMQHLLDTFLDFARADAEDEAAETDPVGIVRDAIAAANREEGRVELGDVVALDGELVKLRPLALRRALDNLLGNALRYGSRARVSVAMTTRTLRITVEDDGPGIPPERREDAMRPFVRLDPARNQDRGSGVGLGLSIVADVARNHGGALRLGVSAALGGLLAEITIAR